MQTRFRQFFAFFTAVLLLAACKKEAELTYLDVVNFPVGLTASTNNVKLSAGNNDSSVITFSWPAVTFKVAAPVTYSLQLDLPSDTIGTTAWSKAKTIEVGKDALSKSFKGSDLNALALSTFGLPKDTANAVVARVIATLDRKVYSNAIAFTVTPFKVTTLKKLWLPGDYQGWNPAAAPVLSEAAGHAEMYEGYVYFPAGGTFQFKMTPQPDWNPMAYGDATGNSGDIIAANYAGGNMTVPGEGYFYLTANLNTMKWTATKTTWSIIGDATPGGWGSDTPLTYDPVNKVWTVTADMKANGSFKFRANNAWTLDFGVDGNGKLVYADNPFLGYTAGLNNLTVPSDGNYTITLDLHNSGAYTYTLHKN